MNCEQARENIILYTELTEQEQQETDQHIQTCAACAAAWEAHVLLTTRIREAAAITPVPRHQAALTHRILAALPAATPASRGLGYLLQQPWLRYTCAVLSLVLVVEFAVEQPATPVDKLTVITHTTQSPVLNTAAFMQHVRERRTHARTVHKQSLLSCLEDNTCDQFAFFKPRTRQ